MISVNQNVTDTFNKTQTVQAAVGALIDINCNTMLTLSDDDLTGNPYAIIDGKSPFQKLFPLDTIVKTFRPVSGGIKYAISGDVALQTWADPRNVNYLPKPTPSTTVLYRTYYPSKDIYYKYFVTPLNANANISIRYFATGTAVSEKNKKVPCNKIVFKFEIGHAIPTSWSVLIDGTDISSGLSKTVPSNGVVELYYTGTGWSRTESSLNSNAHVMVSTLGLTAVNPGGYIGVIELSPHWVKEVTDIVSSFSITKDSSQSSEDILPVGNLTANSLEIGLNGFNETEVIFKSYSRSSTSEIDPDYIYLVKHSEVIPFIKVYHASGTLTDSVGTYYKVPQGVFILDSWSISEYGEASLFCLDYSKVLQETICPDIVCDGYSAVAIIRRILDSVGFTNYNFNLKADDTSIITPDYWWSDSTQTVWTMLQQICRDIQMSASVDENNILQFYSRDYMFDSSRAINWTFRHDAGTSGELPNIINMDLKDLPSTNQVRVLYSTAYLTTYEQSAKELVSVDNTSLVSASIESSLGNVTNATKSTWSEANKYITLKPIFLVDDALTERQAIIPQFSGYLLVNKEIIEYDAIQYEYTTAVNDVVNGVSYNAGAKVKVDITGPNDLAKYRGKAAIVTDSANNRSSVAFVTTNKYRIKSRGALGTPVSAHTSDPAATVQNWQGWKAEWRSK